MALDIESSNYNTLKGRRWRAANKEKTKRLRREAHWRYRDRYNADARRRHQSDPRVCLLCAARHRARKLGLAFNLAKDDVVIPEHCPITGVKIQAQKGKRTDASPSFDRIDLSKGYVKGNVAVISWRANRLKNNGTLAEFKGIVAYMEHHEK